MTRRDVFALPLIPAIGRGREPAPGPTDVAYPSYSACLPDYLRWLARTAYERRERDLGRLTDRAAVAARQRWARDTFWRLIGGRPEGAPLNARTAGALERPGYRIEKVVYESRPGFPVTANLYIPANASGRLPGVLFNMGHYWEGKAYVSYQRCCQGLARLGYLVLAFDPMGQGERFYYPNSARNHSRLLSPDSEHTTPGKQMILYGQTATQIQVWDAVRGLDYLAAHPLVDPSRLGSTGHSGGGTVTMLLAAADDRLAAAAVIMGNTENVACASFHPPGSTDDAEQNFIGSGPAAFDRWDLLYPLAPKPLLVTVSSKDFYATYSPEYIANGREEFRKLQKAYEVLGGGDRVSWAETPLPHALGYDCRMRIYNWFGRWLKGETARVEREPEVAPERPEALRVTDSGSTIVSLGSETPFTLLRKNRPARTPAPLQSLLGIELPVAAEAAVLDQVDARGLRIEALQFHPAAGVAVPAWLLIPAKARRNAPVLLCLDPRGRDALWFDSEPDQALPPDAPVICAADVRGIGDLEPAFSPGAVEYARWHEAEENYAWSSLIFGKPLVAQRALDILAAVSGLAAHPATSGRAVKLAASGKLAVPALFAAALDSRIRRCYLAGGLVSFESIVEREDYSHPFANFVPRLLNHTDLPDIAASVSPRGLVLAGTVDGRGSTLPAESVRRAYPQPHVSVLPAADWSIRGLTAWALES